MSWMSYTLFPSSAADCWRKGPPKQHQPASTSQHQPAATTTTPPPASTDNNNTTTTNHHRQQHQSPPPASTSQHQPAPTTADHHRPPPTTPQTKTPRPWSPTTRPPASAPNPPASSINALPLVCHTTPPAHAVTPVFNINMLSQSPLALLSSRTESNPSPIPPLANSLPQPLRRHARIRALHLPSCTLSASRCIYLHYINTPDNACPLDCRVPNHATARIHPDTAINS
ncbi:hypothetical protein AOQ84DRAFT_229028 [Glonium stellatum]|uniref:Uncharacterized protein n=1 Tax=Glonium stellatum TaxID=574774 RepID=A0A8E2JMD3_9PEZI|nr:hypothetical protein AOQ84DRAFT_229028 [Glonium stellatum]